MDEKTSPLLCAVAQALANRTDTDIGKVKELLEREGEDVLWERYIGPMLDDMERFIIAPDGLRFCERNGKPRFCRIIGTDDEGGTIVEFQDGAQASAREEGLVRVFGEEPGYAQAVKWLRAHEHG